MAQGCTATVCMPTTTPAIKVDAVRRLGGHVDLFGDSYSETQTYAQARTPLHPWWLCGRHPGAWFCAACGEGCHL